MIFAISKAGKADPCAMPMHRRIDSILLIIPIVILAILLSTSARAASATWNGTTNSIWSTSSNWTAGGPPGSGQTATFNNAGNGNTTLNLGTGVGIGTILFDTASAAAYTIGSGAVNSQTLTLDNGGAVTMNSTVAANQLFNAAITLGTNRTASTYTFTNSSTTNTLTFAGNITGSSGSGGGGTGQLKTLLITGGGNGTISGIIANGGSPIVGVTKSGTGTWTLSGTADNSYTGTTTVNGGILELAKTSSAGVDAVSGNITIGDGSTTAGLDILRLAGSGGNQIADTSILTFSGTGLNAGTFRLNGKNETVGGLVSTGGAGVIDDNNATSSTLTVNVTGTNRNFSGIIQNGTGGGTLALTKTGTATQTLSGNNTYTGATIISGGTLEIANAGTSGQISGTTSVTVNSGGTLLLSGISSVNDRINNNADVILGSGATPGTGGIFNTGGLNEGPAGGAAGSTQAMGALTLNSNSTIDFTSGNSSNLLFASLIYTAGTPVTIAHWTGTLFIDNGAATNDRLLFISDTGLSDAQLASFQFTNDAGALLGSGATQIAFNGYFELVPVPEPSTWAAGVLTLLAVGYTQRRRFRRQPALARVS